MNAPSRLYYGHSIRRVAVRLYIIVLLSILCMVFAWYKVDCYIEKEKWKKEEEVGLHSISFELPKYYHETVGDLLIISSKPFLFSGTKASNEELKNELENIAINRRSYFQLTFIDTDGQERVKVNFVGGEVKVASQGQLFYLANQAYFQKTMALTKGDIFVSRFDLSSQSPDTNTPSSSVIRVATPVFDKEKQKKGILIISYFGEKLLNHIKVYDRLNDNNMMLVNENGGWLYRSDFPEFSDSDFKERVIRRVFAYLQHKNEGQFDYKSTLVTFREIEPPEQTVAKVSDTYNTVKNVKFYREERPWVVISTVDQDVLTEGPRQRLTLSGSFFFGIMLALIPFSRVWAEKRVKAIVDDARIKIYAQAIEQSVDLIYITDKNGIIMAANTAVKKKINFTKVNRLDDIDGVSAFEVWRSLPEIADDIRRSINEEDFMVIRHINGCGYRIHYSPLYDSQQQFQGIISVATDISERLKAEAILEKSEKRLSDFASHIESVREGERAAIARDIHDELGSTLTGVKMDLNVVETNLHLPKTDPVAGQLNSINRALEAAIKKVRQVTTNLHPQILSDLGLHDALEWLLEEFQRRSGVKCHFNLCEDSEELSEIPYNIALGVYRVIQECLNNILKHANARNVSIRLNISAGNLLIISICDDGVGASSFELFEKNTYGVLGMQERARHLNGELAISSSIGGGTCVELRVPTRNEGSHECLNS